MFMIRLHPLEETRFAAHNEQGMRPLAPSAQGLAKDCARYRSDPGRLVQWEMSGIASGNCMRTYIFLFQPVSLFGKVMHAIVVSHLTSFGPDIFMI